MLQSQFEEDLEKLHMDSRYGTKSQINHAVRAFVT